MPAAVTIAPTKTLMRTKSASAAEATANIAAASFSSKFNPTGSCELRRTASTMRVIQATCTVLAVRATGRSPRFCTMRYAKPASLSTAASASAWSRIDSSDAPV
jgi:hypothetical protein